MKTKNFEKIFKDHLNLNIELTKKTFLNYNIVLKIFNFLHKKIENKNKIFVYGNGGSFADASHFVSELTATYKKKIELDYLFFYYPQTYLHLLLGQMIYILNLTWKEKLRA